MNADLTAGRPSAPDTTRQNLYAKLLAARVHAGRAELRDANIAAAIGPTAQGGNGKENPTAGPVSRGANLPTLPDPLIGSLAGVREETNHVRQCQQPGRARSDADCLTLAFLTSGIFGPLS